MEFETVKYVVIKEGTIFWDTAFFNRSTSIRSAMEGSSLTWKDFRKMGFKCIKFKITATALNCMDFHTNKLTGK